MTRLAEIEVALEGSTEGAPARTVGLLHQEGAGPAVLLLHGAGHGAHHLASLAGAIRGREVFVLDAPGRGRSPGPALDRVSELAWTAASAMRALGRREWIACGHSLGGAVALECALLEDGLAPRGLALLASGARLRVSPAILESVRSAAETGVSALTPAPAFSGASPETRARIHALDATIPPASALADWTAADGFDRMADLPRVRARGLVISGTLDPLTPEKYARTLAGQLPDARLALIEGAGHMFPMERREETARLIGELAASFSRAGA